MQGKIESVNKGLNVDFWSTITYETTSSNLVRDTTHYLYMVGAKKFYLTIDGVYWVEKLPSAVIAKLTQQKIM